MNSYHGDVCMPRVVGGKRQKLVASPYILISSWNILTSVLHELLFDSKIKGGNTKEMDEHPSLGFSSSGHSLQSTGLTTCLP